MPLFPPDQLCNVLHSRFEAMDTFDDADAEDAQAKAAPNPGAGGKTKTKNKRKGGGPARDEVDDMSVRELRAALAKFSVAIPRRASR